MKIVVVAALAANAGARASLVAISAPCRRTNSAARTASRSIWFSAHRYSIGTFGANKRHAPRRSADAPGSDCGSFASAEFKHASALAYFWNDIRKRAGKLSFGERLGQFRQ